MFLVHMLIRSNFVTNNLQEEKFLFRLVPPQATFYFFAHFYLISLHYRVKNQCSICYLFNSIISYCSEAQENIQWCIQFIYLLIP